MSIIGSRYKLKSGLKRITSMFLASTMLLSFMPTVFPVEEAEAAYETGYDDEYGGGGWEVPPNATKIENAHLYSVTDDNTYFKGYNAEEHRKNIVDPMDKNAGKMLESLGYLHSSYSWGQVWRDSDGGWSVNSNSVGEQADNDWTFHDNIVTAEDMAKSMSLENTRSIFIRGLQSHDALEHFETHIWANNYPDPKGADQIASKKVYDAIEAGKDLYINISPKDKTATMSQLFRLNKNGAAPAVGKTGGEIINADVTSIKRHMHAEGFEQYDITITLPLNVQYIPTGEGTMKTFDKNNKHMRNKLPVPREGCGFASASVQTVTNWKEAFRQRSSAFITKEMGRGVPMFWLGKDGTNPYGALTVDKTTDNMGFGILGAHTDFQDAFMGVKDRTYQLEYPNWDYETVGNWDQLDEQMQAFNGMYRTYTKEKGRNFQFLHTRGFGDYTPHSGSFYADHNNGWKEKVGEKPREGHSDFDTDTMAFDANEPQDLDKGYTLGTWGSMQTGGAFGYFMDWNISAEVFVEPDRKPSVAKYYYDNLSAYEGVAEDMLGLLTKSFDTIQIM